MGGPGSGRKASGGAKEKVKIGTIGGKKRFTAQDRRKFVAATAKGGKNKFSNSTFKSRMKY